MVVTKREDESDENPVEKKRDQKVKPGQRFPTPTPGFADRVFYETLLRQRPESAMAQEWCVNYGVLPKEEAAYLNKKVMARKKRGGTAPSSSSSKNSSAKKSRKSSSSKIVADVAVSAGLQVGTGGEGMGSAAL
mmetsp:Transcript_1803/g.2702  ORF Transcript_1803/g.2702 Transcript_1803/m.2702 type:complete len:134 (+) Transcript_1803:108-509(+)|eukprot:CAMPEP_0195519634 /NCGR_PEP_ID=MMETSP0794_2-20130614/15172_1 /TAXON_ID=515487 /ORGANISM="Stephanopyxis turris, Strain CCMP 815" /LENGTH=133 /DNA_ID=CAMNT_0040648821 /DNA_START=108 /DNA_END=509 /DNA_ORIENTATION=+